MSGKKTGRKLANLKRECNFLHPQRGGNWMNCIACILAEIKETARLFIGFPAEFWVGALKRFKM
jgi:hypothetical protein